MPLAFFHYSSQHKPFTFVERESAPMHIFWETITFFLRRITLVLNGCQNEESCVAVTGGYGGITFCFLLFVSIVYPRLFNSTECIKPGHKPHTLKKKKKKRRWPAIYIYRLPPIRTARILYTSILFIIKITIPGLSYAAHPWNMVMCLSKVRRQVYHLFMYGFMIDNWRKISDPSGVNTWCLLLPEIEASQMFHGIQ